MCKTYNTIGSLRTLKSHLQINNIHDFKSLREVLDFQSAFPDLKQQLVCYHTNLIEHEKIKLEMELQEFGKAIENQRQESEQRLAEEINELKHHVNNLLNSKPKNIFQKLVKSFTHRRYKSKINQKEHDFDKAVNMSISNLINTYEVKSNRYQFIMSNVNDAIMLSAQYPLLELERKKTIIDELNTFIFGALGEQQVVKTLESLSDDYFLINDFAVSFSPAIYNKQANDYIKSVQIDHILIGPSGVFLIETKNWSEKSLANLSLRSPVEQIKRTNFVLFKLLNNEMSNHFLRLKSHHWGEKKITIKNLIVLINRKPKEEFQYVKILTVNELLGYVTYFKPSLSVAEVKGIAEFLVQMNSKKTIAIE